MSGEKDYSELTEEQQVEMIRQTNNGLKPEDAEIEQPKQDKDWKPNPDEVVDSL